jgi:hypothetical protein
MISFFDHRFPTYAFTNMPIDLSKAKVLQQIQRKPEPKPPYVAATRDGMFEFPACEDDGDTAVYLMHWPNTDFFKIGISDNPYVRVTQVFGPPNPADDELAPPREKAITMQERFAHRAALLAKGKAQVAFYARCANRRDAFKIERKLHSEFSPFRLGYTEWFILPELELPLAVELISGMTHYSRAMTVQLAHATTMQ